MALVPARSPVDTSPPRWQAVCKACGRSFPVPEAETDELLDSGWPVCCGRDMTILYHANGLPPGDPSPPSGE